jgi:hypothetical protein
LKLQELPARSEDGDFVEYRELVTRLWTQLLTNET